MATLRRLIRAGIAVAGLLLWPVPAGAEDVSWAVASIKPIHSLLAGVMAGVGTPALLVKGHASPHSFALKPSDAALLEQARILFWVGPALERFLVRPIETLGSRAHLVPLLETDGLTRLAVREGGVWDPYEHDEDHAAEQGPDEAVDGHIWLDPANARLIVRRMALELGAADPERATRYAENAAKLEDRLVALETELRATLAPVAGRPFIVFHDAYHYFEARYGLNGAGSVTLDPDQPPGAERLAAIQARLAADGAVCVFHEPQYPTELVETVARGTGARIGELDPEGANLPDGPELYFTLLRNIAAALSGCLGR